MAEHDLKIWPSYFKAVQEGRKTFEVRRADRDFDVGDILVLKEWDPNTPPEANWTAAYSGRELRARVTYLLRAFDNSGIAPGYVVMAIHIESPPKASP